MSRLGGWDGGDAASATRFFEGCQTTASLELTCDVHAAGPAEWVTTDRIQFFATPGDSATRLDQIERRVFSEAMRDVDLFVGVSSIGRDPFWEDRDSNSRFADYRERYAFGRLCEVAKQRRELIKRLLPRLKIASQCKVVGNYLVVKGALKKYKIHLRSANVLMSPSDAHLCIVPRDHDAAYHGLHLPFEGDFMLSLILSKAQLLAEDHAIKDPLIVAQLKGR